MKKAKERAKTKMFKSEIGITLITLVVTIVVLLILLGITISLVFNENGIIKLAQQTKNEAENMQQEELGRLEGVVQDLENTTIEMGLAPEGAVAKTKEKYYPKLQMAIDEAKINENTKIFLLKDIKENVVVQKDKDIALYMEGYSLTNLIESTETIIVEGKLFVTNGNINANGVTAITNKGELEIDRNSTINGFDRDMVTIYNESIGKVKIIGGTITSKQVNAINNHGTLEIGKNANISNIGKVTDETGNHYYPAIITRDKAITTITGGNISSKEADGIWNKIGGTTNIQGGTITSEQNDAIDNEGTATIQGGTITSKQGNAISNYGTATIIGGTITSEQLNAIKNHGTLEIGKNANISNIGKVTDETGNHYYSAIITRDKAITTITGGNISSREADGIWNQIGGTTNIQGGTITSEQNDAIDNEGTATIQGGTITSEQNDAINNHGTATIIGGTITSKQDNAISNYGTLEIGKNANISNIGKVTDETGNHYYPAIITRDKAITTITGGNISSKEADGISNKIGGTTNIQGGTITSEQNDAIDNEGTATIQGGTITSEQNNAIYNYGTLEIGGSANISNIGINNEGTKYPAVVTSDKAITTITGGNISSKQSIGIKNGEGGTTSIQGGTITSEQSNAINNHGTLEIGGSANISSSNSNGGYPTVYNQSTGMLTITNGTITHTNGGYAVYNKGGQVTHTGGTISKKYGF